ncbi:MAG TPA: XdhC family protein, partial [Pyrinomonadaceae bacterium]
MSKEIELWQFIADRLTTGERIVLLVVAESHGSSPGRAGYKMAVAENGDLIGSIGGGVMEVNLVEQARSLLSEPPAVADCLTTKLIEQEHRKNTEHPSGMICSGRQTVLRRVIAREDLDAVETVLAALESKCDAWFVMTQNGFSVQ